jgi:hypothetical protein
MDNLDFTNCSRESWTVLKKLKATQPSYTESKVSPNDVSNILFKTSNIKSKKYKKKKKGTNTKQYSIGVSKDRK